MIFKCKYCGNDTYITKQLAGSSSLNAMVLYCRKCGKWQKWLNKAERKLYTTHIATSIRTNPCLYCGDELPEGKQVCYSCEERLTSGTAETKSLRWVCNQIPDDLGDSIEEKMLKCIKHYCNSGAYKITELAKQNEEIKHNSISKDKYKALVQEEVKREIEWLVGLIRYAPFNVVGELQKMTAEEYADKLEALLTEVCEKYGIAEENPLAVPDDEYPF